MRTSLLFIGHLLNDGFASFLAPLLPLLLDRLDLSYAMAGLLGTTRVLMNSLLQPGLGHPPFKGVRPTSLVRAQRRATSKSLFGTAF